MKGAHTRFPNDRGRQSADASGPGVRAHHRRQALRLVLVITDSFSATPAPSSPRLPTAVEPRQLCHNDPNTTQTLVSSAPPAASPRTTPSFLPYLFLFSAGRAMTQLCHIAVGMPGADQRITFRSYGIAEWAGRARRAQGREGGGGVQCQYPRVAQPVLRGALLECGSNHLVSAGCVVGPAAAHW